MSEDEYRLAAIMFTDIVGYSRLMGEDEPRTVRLLGEYRRILGGAIRAHGGEVLQFIGDAVFARFESGVAAVRAGIDIQNALAEFNRGSTEAGAGVPALLSRIGIHLGDVMVRGTDLFGDDVNIAARLEPLADPGCICISHAVYEQVRDKPDITAVPLGAQTLKNIRERIQVYQVVPGGVSRRRRLHFAWRAVGAWTRSNSRLTAAAALAVAIGLGALIWPRLFQPESANASYLAVEPFRNLSPGTLDEYVREGMLEAITSRLSGIPRLYLVASNQSIGAPYVLRGAMQRQGSSLRVSYKVVRRKDNAELAGRTADGDVREIFALQDRLAESIAADLESNLGVDAERLSALKLTDNIGAYDIYLQARDYLRRPKSTTNADNAAKLFREALAADPTFARAEAGLCEALWIKYDLSRDTELVNEATQACERANQLDANLVEVHLAMGKIQLGRGRFEDAVTEFERAIDIDPKNEDAFRGLANVYMAQNLPKKAEQSFRRAISLQPGYWAGYYGLANFLVARERFDEAIPVYRTVLRLTPDNVYAFSNLGAAYFLSGQFDEAIHAYRRSLEITPTNDSYSNLGTALYYKGDFAEAAQMFRRATELAPDDYRMWANLADATAQAGDTAATKAHCERAMKLAQDRLAVNPADAEAYGYVARCAAALGHKDAALQALHRALDLGNNTGGVFLTAAVVFNRLGDADAALDNLEQAASHGYPVKLLTAEPEFTNLNAEPRFRRLLAGK